MAAEAEAERLGRVAVHHRTGRETCPFPANDPRSKLWLRGWDKASKRHNRPDFPSAMAEGFRAFQDGLHEAECPKHIAQDRQLRELWRQGWEKARLAKEKYDEEAYR